jgi:MFS family permease
LASLTQALHLAQISTFSAFSHSNFRIYFAGQLVSVSGTWVQTVAQGWLVFHLTRSELYLGLVACAAGLPALLLSPYAGVLVDRTPRRTILIATQAAQLLLALILAALTFAGMVEVWHVIFLAFILGIVQAFDAPARQSFVMDMVGPDSLASGISLNSTMYNSARIVGPTIAGIVLATIGPGWCFLLNALSFLAVIASLWKMSVRVTIKRDTMTSPLTQLKEGLRFVRGHDIIKPVILLSAITSILCVNIVTLLPAFAATVLNSPIEAYATISTAQGVGAVSAGLLALFVSRFGRGRVVAAMDLLLCLSVLLVSRTAVIPLAVVLMAVVGFSLILMFITMNTLIQTIVPDQYRGRVMSLYTLTFFGLAPFGALVLGYIASRIGVPDALALYAILNGVLVIGILARWPSLWQNRPIMVSSQLSAVSKAS